MASVKTAGRNYTIELFVLMALYVGLLYVRPVLLHAFDNQALQTAVKLLPILPLWLVFLAVIRFYRRIDEYAQRQLLLVLSISFGITACMVTSYSFLMDIGFPPLSLYWAWPLMAVCWALTQAVFSLRDK